MRYSSRAAAISVTGTPAGIAAITTVSNTPRPPGTWLMTPAIVAAAKIPTNAMNDGPPSGSKTYKVAAAIMVSTAVKNSCARMIRMFGMASVNCRNLNGDLRVASHTMLPAIEAAHRIETHWIVAGLSGVAALIASGKKPSATRPTNVMPMPIATEIYPDKAATSKAFSPAAA